MKTPRAVIVAVLFIAALPAAAAPPDELKYLPADSNLVVAARPELLLTSAAWKSLLAGARDSVKILVAQIDADIKAQTGLPLADVDSLLVGGNVKNSPIVVLRLKKAITPADVAAARKADGPFKESKVGTSTLYSSDSGASFCVPDDRTLIVGKTTELHGVLVRGKLPAFSSFLQSALDRMDFAAPLALAVDVEGTRTALPDRTPFMLAPGLDLHPMVEVSTNVAITLKAGADFDVRASVQCYTSKDSAGFSSRIPGLLARLARDAVENGVVPKEAAEIVQKAKAEVNGDSVVINLRCPPDTVVKYFNPGGR
jgi:hypothetical protein